MWATLLPVAVDPAVSLTAALAVSGVLIAAAAPKLRMAAHFEDTVVEYRILPEQVARWFARILPWAELALAILLLPMATRSAGAMALALLLTAYAAAIAINLLRGRTSIDCGCGTAGNAALRWPMLGRNAFLLALLAIAAGAQSERFLMLADIPTVLFGGAALTGLYLTADLLLANTPRMTQLRRPK